MRTAGQVRASTYPNHRFVEMALALAGRWNVRTRFAPHFLTKRIP